MAILVYFLKNKLKIKKLLNSKKMKLLIIKKII